MKRNFTKIIKSYFDKEGITVEQSRVASGTEFKILSGLEEQIKIDDQFIVDFFNNGHNIKEIDNTDELAEATIDFNSKYNMSLTSGIFKKAVKKIQAANDDMPY